MILKDVMDELGTRLDTIEGLRIYDYPADQIVPPAAVIAYPDDIEFHLTYGQGMSRITLPVLVMVGKANDRAARDNLAGYCDDSGATSILAVAESGTYSAFDVASVTRADFDVVKVAGVDYAAALFSFDIVG